MSVSINKTKAKAECMAHFKEINNKRKEHESMYYQDVSLFLNIVRTKTLDNNVKRSDLHALIGISDGNFSNFINSKSRKNRIPYHYAFWLVLATASSYDEALIMMARSGNIMDDSSEILCLSRALFMTLCIEKDYTLRLSVAAEIINETPYYDFFMH